MHIRRKDGSNAGAGNMLRSIGKPPSLRATVMAFALGFGVLGLFTGAWSPASANAGAVQEFQATQESTPTPCRAMSRKDRVTLDFREAPLRDVARLVSCLRDVNLMFVPSALGKKTVSVVSSRPVDRDAVWSLFLSALSQHGLVTERRGGFYAILPR